MDIASIYQAKIKVEEAIRNSENLNSDYDHRNRELAGICRNATDVVIDDPTNDAPFDEFSKEAFKHLDHDPEQQEALKHALHSTAIEGLLEKINRGAVELPLNASDAAPTAQHTPKWVAPPIKIQQPGIKAK